MTDHFKREQGMELIDTGYRKGKEKTNRIVVLEARINPQGATKPYWRVKNTVTGTISTIREDRIVGPRWVHVPE